MVKKGISLIIMFAMLFTMLPNIKVYADPANSINQMASFYDLQTQTVPGYEMYVQYSTYMSGFNSNYSMKTFKRANGTVVSGRGIHLEVFSGITMPTAYRIAFKLDGVVGTPKIKVVSFNGTRNYTSIFNSSTLLYEQTAVEGANEIMITDPAILQVIKPSSGYANIFIYLDQAVGTSNGMTEEATMSEIQLQGIYPAEKAALTTAINAEYSDGATRTTLNLNSADYAADSWAAYLNALDEAKTVEGNGSATQNQVNSAISSVSTIKTAMILTTSLTALNTAKASAGALTQADYVAGSWTVLSNALSMTETTNLEVVAKTSAINTAISNLITTANQALLDTAKSNAAALVQADYTNGSWSNLVSALGAAESTNAQVTAKTTAINTAIDNLVTVASQTALDTAKTNANALNQSDYVVASWSALTTSLSLPEVTNAQVVTKTSSINTAVANLITLVEQAALENEKTRATTFVQASYTASSWTALSTALALPEGTKAQVVAKTTAITTAISQLRRPVVERDEPSTPAPTPTVVPKVETPTVIVNGGKISIGSESLGTIQGKTTVTVKTESSEIEKLINANKLSTQSDQTNTIQIQVSNTSANVAKVELDADIIKKLEDNEFLVSVKKNQVEYVIPAQDFNVKGMLTNFGLNEKNLKDIKVEVQISQLDQVDAKKLSEVVKSQGAEIIFPPVAFEVVAKTTKLDGTTNEVEINKFSNYVERIMEIPAGVDPSKITTGIVFNTDGSYSHVPTDVFKKDNKWFAKLNSLTNSNYSVIWNPITVKSVENHWSKNAVNDMASRMIIVKVDSFVPDKAINRADFAEYLVRALGLYRENTKLESKFKDVNASSSSALAIQIASEYGIISGYSDGTFKPDGLVTREEAMTMYQKAMKIVKLTGSDTNNYQKYSDFNAVGNWAKPYVQEALSAHVFSGTSASKISPKSNLTYAEAAQAIRNLLVQSNLINE